MKKQEQIQQKLEELENEVKLLWLKIKKEK